MPVRLFLIFIILSLSVRVKAQIDTPSVFVKTYSPAQLRQDIKYVRDTLTQKHPNLYWYISKHKLNKKFDSLEKAIQAPLTAVQFKYKLQCVLSSIGDGHIGLLVNGAKISPADKIFFYEGATYPIQKLSYKIISGKIYVTGNRSENNAIEPGAEILSINGQLAPQLLAQLQKAVATDGYNQTFKNETLNMPAYLAQTYCFINGLQEKLTFTIKQNDSIKTCVLSISARRVTVPDTTKTIINTTTISGSSNPAYIKVSQFNNSEDPFITFFGMVKNQGVKCLMLDLRDNTGGSYIQMVKLFAHLINKPTFFSNLTLGNKLSNEQRTITKELELGCKTPIMPDSNHFDGKLYVMVNGLTFSAAALLTANLQATNRGIIIGEETGGGRNGCIGGVYHEAFLPNSGLLFRFGLDQFKIPNQVKQQGRGVMPDVPISYTIDDYLANNDLETEWIKNDIKVKGILK